LAMLEFLRDSGRLTPRKARLFGTACCRRVWPMLQDEELRVAVQAVERCADGLEDEAKLVAIAAEAGRGLRSSLRGEKSGFAFAKSLGCAFRCVTAPVDLLLVRHCVKQRIGASHAGFVAAASAVSGLQQTSSDVLRAWVEEDAVQCDVLRDLFGAR